MCALCVHGEGGVCVWHEGEIWMHCVGYICEGVRTCVSGSSE